MYQLPAAEGIPNGEVEVMDLGQLQKEKQDLEQQLLEKNKVRALSGSAVHLPALSLYLCGKLASPFLESLRMPRARLGGDLPSSAEGLPGFPPALPSFHTSPTRGHVQGQSSSSSDFRCSQPPLLSPVGPTGPDPFPPTSFPRLWNDPVRPDFKWFYRGGGVLGTKGKWP